MVLLQFSWFEKIRMFTKFVSFRLQLYMLDTNEKQVIDTNYGKVKGIKRRTVYQEDGHYYAFEGIPYAKPPIGELRFKAPQPMQPWEGIRDCTYLRDKPKQLNFMVQRMEGSEDCLYLNVYAKTLKSDKPLPVMVWIYGGGFQFGEATRDMYGPDYFMKKDVLLVSMNYRVGALGFLTLQDEALQVPGNAGLKDQVMALRWIKENIKHFNGDENNITLFGLSAGGASVHYMLLTEQTKNLFHKAIMQSGSFFNPWGFPQLPNMALRLARALGYEGSENDSNVLSYLRAIDAANIAAIDNTILTTDEETALHIFPFLPVVEPYITEQCVVPQHPREMLKTAWSNRIPVIMGYTANEGLFSYPQLKACPAIMDDLLNSETWLPIDAKENRSKEEIKAMAAKMHQIFFAANELNLSNRFDQFLDYLSYYYFVHGVHRAMLARLKYAAQTPSYLYRFGFDSQYFNHFRILWCGRDQIGVAHGDDISYLFYHILSSKLPSDAPEYQTITRMINLWTSFAATSNPNSVEIPSLAWKPVEPNVDAAPKCCNISEEIEFKDVPEWKKLQAWDSLYTDDTLF